MYAVDGSHSLLNHHISPERSRAESGNFSFSTMGSFAMRRFELEGVPGVRRLAVSRWRSARRVMLRTVRPSDGDFCNVAGHMPFARNLANVESILGE
jgi:hypothetical protein